MVLKLAYYFRLTPVILFTFAIIPGRIVLASCPGYVYECTGKLLCNEKAEDLLLFEGSRSEIKIHLEKVPGTYMAYCRGFVRVKIRTLNSIWSGNGTHNAKALDPVPIRSLPTGTKKDVKSLRLPGSEGCTP